VETYSTEKQCAGLKVRNTDMTKPPFPKLQMHSLVFQQCFS